MKKTPTSTILLLALLVAFVSSKNDVVTPEIRIGEYTWMVRNLHVDHFQNGDPIWKAQSAEDWDSAGANKLPAYCIVPNVSLDSLDCYVYNWYALADKRGIAPAGWHIAKSAEWDYLSSFLGGWRSSERLKSKTAWPIEGNPTNESGFTALPVGARDLPDTFIYVNERALWWGRSPSDSMGLAFRYISKNSSPLDAFKLTDGYASKGLAARCVKDY